MNNICNNRTKILIISDENTYNQIVQHISTYTPNVDYELITVKEEAIARLQHNNYDVLLLQYGFIQNLHSYDLLKMSYAMCKPSIILHNSIINYTIDKLLFRFSTMHKNYIFSKFLINHLYDPGFKSINNRIDLVKSQSKNITLNDIYNNIVCLLKHNMIQLNIL